MKPWRNDDADLLRDTSKAFAANHDADRRDILLGLAGTFRGGEAPEAVADRLLAKMEEVWQDPTLLAEVEHVAVMKAIEHLEVGMEVADGLAAMQAQRKLKGLPEMPPKEIAKLSKTMEQEALKRRHPVVKTFAETIAEEKP